MPWCSSTTEVAGERCSWVDVDDPVPKDVEIGCEGKICLLICLVRKSEDDENTKQTDGLEHPFHDSNSNFWVSPPHF